MNDKHPRLPTEVMALILRHMRPSALRQCLLVNSTFNALVQPLLYRFVSYDETGVSFPQVKRSSPFEEPPFPRDRLATILRDVDRLEVRVHDNYPHLPLRLPRSGPLDIVSSRVFVVHLEIPDDVMDMASVHRLHGPADYLGDRHPPQLHPASCHIVQSTLENVPIQKLVLRNVPAAYGDLDPDLMSAAASNTIREVVVVLNPESMKFERWNATEDWLEDHDCKDATSGPCEGEANLSDRNLMRFDPVFLPTANEFTFVFWTPVPGAEVAPPCCHVRERLKDDIDLLDGAQQSPSCDCLEPSDHPPESKFENQNSCWEEPFLMALAGSIAEYTDISTLRKITIVNASAIVPDKSHRERSLSAIAMGFSTHDEFEDRLRTELRQYATAKFSHEEAAALQDRIEFVYMKDWLSSTRWEDVFDREEVNPWLQFKKHPKITDWFKPMSPDDVQ